MTGKICPECGTEHEGAGNSCKNCGSKLIDKDEPSSHDGMKTCPKCGESQSLRQSSAKTAVHHLKMKLNRMQVQSDALTADVNLKMSSSVRIVERKQEFGCVLSAGRCQLMRTIVPPADIGLIQR